MSMIREVRFADAWGSTLLVNFFQQQCRRERWPMESAKLHNAACGAARVCTRRRSSWTPAPKC